MTRLTLAYYFCSGAEILPYEAVPLGSRDCGCGSHRQVWVSMSVPMTNQAAPAVGALGRAQPSAEAWAAWTLLQEHR